MLIKNLDFLLATTKLKHVNRMHFPLKVLPESVTFLLPTTKLNHVNRRHLIPLKVLPEKLSFFLYSLENHFPLYKMH